MGLADFCIIGAPKCGTTALYAYLRDHPGVFMPEPKEPHYFCTDFPNYRKVRSCAAYRELFQAAPPGVLLGEASVWYLFSEVAVARILDDNPASRMIVMLRNPVDMVWALHAQLIHSLDEDVLDLETAWDLQAARAQGQHLPVHCREPKHLQYRAAGSYSHQLERLFRLVPRDRVLLLL